VAAVGEPDQLADVGQDPRRAGRADPAQVHQVRPTRPNRGRELLVQALPHPSSHHPYDRRDFIYRGTIDVASVRIWPRHWLSTDMRYAAQP
jgi:hypothetical protein